MFFPLKCTHVFINVADSAGFPSGMPRHQSSYTCVPHFPPFSPPSLLCGSPPSKVHCTPSIHLVVHPSVHFLRSLIQPTVVTFQAATPLPSPAPTSITCPASPAVSLMVPRAMCHDYRATSVLETTERHFLYRMSAYRASHRIDVWILSYAIESQRTTISE